jgi:hypothetical protein
MLVTALAAAAAKAASTTKITSTRPPTATDVVEEHVPGCVEFG